MDKNITKARAYFYEFLAYPLFFHTSDEKFARWREQLSYLAQNPLSEQSAEAFANLDKFSFKELVNEQNEVLFGFTNIPLSASFYEEGRDNGAFLNDEFNGAKNISDKLFSETLNLFVDEFGSLLLAHKNANFFRSYALILKDFIELERAVLNVEAPTKPQGDSVAMAALKKEPFQSKMPTIKTKLHWEEFSPVISHEFTG